MADDIHITATRPANGRGTLPGGPDGNEPQLGELFRQLAQDSATLVRQEVALAKAEFRDAAKVLSRNAVMVGVGAVLALIGGLVLVAFLVILLGDVLDNYWLGALIVGALFLIVGGLMASKALKTLKRESLAPEQTIQTLKEDKQWLQTEIKQAKRDLA
jgi:uncharacterized membrane protein YqjE